MRLTAFELSCGAVERTTDEHGHSVSLWREHGVYHVLKSNQACVHAWLSAETYKEARKHVTWLRRAVLLPSQKTSLF